MDCFKITERASCFKLERVSVCVTLHRNDITIEEAIEDIKQNKKEIDEIEFVNEKDEKLPNTCYSYLRSFLEEAGLIQKVNSNESKLINSSDKIFTQILL